MRTDAYEFIEDVVCALVLVALVALCGMVYGS